VSTTPLPPGVGASTARWLFSQHFLAERLPEWPEFSSLDTQRLHEELLALWRAESAGLTAANEGQTEERLIRPALRLLGHSFTLFAEIPGAGRTPDYLFYASDADRQAADQASAAVKVERALAVGDAKRFGLPLDRRSPEGDPVAQVRDYVLFTRLPFGILTNGRIWRLYARDAALVERACHEVDLVTLLEQGQPADLRYFAAFFGIDALPARSTPSRFRMPCNRASSPLCRRSRAGSWEATLAHVKPSTKRLPTRWSSSTGFCSVCSPNPGTSSRSGTATTGAIRSRSTGSRSRHSSTNVGISPRHTTGSGRSYVHSSG